DHCIMCKEELSEDFDHLMRCTALQESWEEIEEATAQSIVKLQDEKEDNAEALREIKEILIPKEKEQRFQRRRELVTGLIGKKMSKDLLILASGEERKKLWIDSILFIMQRSFSEIIWSMRYEKVNRWEKKERGRKKEWIEGIVDEVVRGIIKKGEIVWWSFL